MELVKDILFSGDGSYTRKQFAVSLLVVFLIYAILYLTGLLAMNVYISIIPALVYWNSVNKRCNNINFNYWTLFLIVLLSAFLDSIIRSIDGHPITVYMVALGITGFLLTSKDDQPVTLNDIE